MESINDTEPPPSLPRLVTLARPHVFLVGGRANWLAPNWVEPRGPKVSDARQGALLSGRLYFSLRSDRLDEIARASSPVTIVRPS